jgi:hypothetical protein
MSNFACACGASGSGLEANLGVQRGALTFKFTKRFLILNRIATDGTVNEIKATDLVNGNLPASFLEEKLYNSDLSKRWLLTPDIEEYTDARDSPITEQIGNGTGTIVDLGNRAITGVFKNPQETFLRNLTKLECKDLAFYVIDGCGTIGGEWLEGGTVLSPLPIATKTFYAMPMPGTQSTQSKIQIQLELDRTFSDSDFDILPNGAIANGKEYLLRGAQSMQNVKADITAISTTGFTATLTLEAGNFPKAIKGVGWTATDFELFNNTTLSVVPITGATETVVGSSGVYTFVIPAQTASDNLTLSPAILANKFVKAPLQLATTSFDIP